MLQPGLFSIPVGFSIPDIRIIIKKRELPLDPEGKKCYGYVRGYACLARLNGPGSFKKNTPITRETKMVRFLKFLLPAILFTAIVVHEPMSTDDPSASREDRAKEDLSRVVYPSTEPVAWHPVFIRPQDTLETLYGDDWPFVARFNRVDRRHVYPGMTLKVPKDLGVLRTYTPMPRIHEPALPYYRYILINMEEQWLGAYEYGELQFSVPAATGKPGFETPTGIFRVDARHRDHTSSLYKTDDGEEQYPMDYAMRFHIDGNNVAYWIHARDLPGRPASHGCVGLFDEEMQQRLYGFPEKPVLMDAKRVYEWAVGDNEYEGVDSGDLELLEDGPIVEVIGKNPAYLSAPPRKPAGK